MTVVQEDRSVPLRWAVAAGGAVLLVLAGTACQDSSADGEPGQELQDGQEGYDPELAERMSEQLEEMDFANVAEYLLDEEQTTLTRLDTPYLVEWEIYEVSYVGDVAPQSWHVATSEEISILLNGLPDAFDAVLQEDPGPRDTDQAVAAARDYLTMTAPSGDDLFVTVLDSTEDIVLWPEFEEEAQQIEDEFGDEVEPPHGVEDGTGAYTVTAYVQNTLALERRTVTIASDGSVTEESETLVERMTDP